MPAWLLQLRLWWYRRPSWVVEIVGGAGVYLLVAAWPWALVRLILATAASAVYEAVLDANGWSWADVGQRQAVIGLVELVRHMAESWVGV